MTPATAVSLSIAAIGVLIAFLALLQRRTEYKENSISKVWEEVHDHGERIAVVESSVGHFWTFFAKNAAQLHQPTHRVMDDLLDRIDQLDLEELHKLKDEFNKVMKEPEPRPGYKANIALAMFGLTFEIGRREYELRKSLKKTET